MPFGTEVATVERVRSEGSVLLTATDAYGRGEEIILVPCERDGDASSDDTDDVPSDDSSDDEASSEIGVEAWIDRCPGGQGDCPVA